MGFDPVALTSPKHEASLPGACADREVINDFVYYRTGAVGPVPVPFAGELRLMHALYRRILEVARREEPDILHAHSPVLNAFPAIRAARRLGIPVVYEIRAFWEDAAVDHGTYAEGSWKYRLTRRLETRACSRVDHVAVLCNGLKKDLIGRGIAAEKITPVFNGVDVDDFRPCVPDPEYLRKWGLDGKCVIGFLGSFYRYEGLDLLIRAFARVAAERADAVLLLAGAGGGRGMKAMVSPSARRAGDHAGRIAHEQVPGVYALIDVLAYPRYSMRLTELVTPLKPLEAMAMGKAVLASDVGGHRELIRHGETGILFKAGDEAALAGELLHLLADRQLSEGLQGRGRTWVRQHHSWEQTTGVYRRVYSFD